MPSYALLGATGDTGSKILPLLLKRSETKVHVLVRSRPKLENQLSNSIPANLTIFEGGLSDIDLVTKCIAGTSTVFITLGPPGNEPGCSIVQDAVSTLIAAMHTLSTTDTKLPHILLLSSASTEPALARDMPRLLHSLVTTGLHHIYADVYAAERALRAQHTWIASTFVKPGGLSDDDGEPHGHVLTAERCAPGFLSFADLAAGMVEVADRGPSEWDQRFVSVLPARPGTRAAWKGPWTVVKGLVAYWLPWTYGWLH